MEITDKTVDELAHLARLQFEGAEKERIKKDLNRILGFMEKLNELDTEGVEPLIYLSEEINVMRYDESRQTITQKQALKNAPKRDSDYFKVPKVLKNPQRAKNSLCHFRRMNQKPLRESYRITVTVPVWCTPPSFSWPAHTSPSPNTPSIFHT
jgi:aspartyl-tRNA(Asn)/glutamyl-tRNA(Gln) amidotransferase subunit C